jgi:hypothetical protein
MSSKSTAQSMVTRSFKTRIVPMFLAALAIGCGSFGQAALSAPNQTPPQAYQNWVNQLGSTQLGIGQSMATTLAIAMASNVTFSWQTAVPATAGGKWSVTNSPKGSALATGFAACPGPNQPSQFTINFASFAPQKAPDKSAPLTYYVTIQPADANQKGLGLPSNVVTVVYAGK